MIILDTNVVSELMKAHPDDRVLAWISARPASVLHITSITQAEILHGILLLPPGKRRTAIQAAAEAMFENEFEHRIQPFDSAAAIDYARIAAERRKAGRPISQLDAQIAAIARCRRGTIATRNVQDFEDCGVPVANPWQGDA